MPTGRGVFVGGNPDGAYPLPGESAFSFVGKRDVFTLQLVFARPAGAVYPPARREPKPLFLLIQKKKRFWTPKKKRVDQWKSWGGAVQQDRLPMLRCYSSGERLWAILLFPAARV